ncbi:MAG: SDR family oxidoreductase [Gammaproteobacteria bacterium]|nr:SDR family oxidoreductase [Gammaproteobacteria bacterium]
MSRERPAALVTGGSAGIGKSICEHLLQSGYAVINLSRRGSDYEHEHLEDVAVDLADVDATRDAVLALKNRYDITNIVHNAGVIRPALVEDVDLRDVGYLSRLHVHASVTLAQAALPAMKAANFGRIVIIGSRAMLGLEQRTAYAATKAAQIGLVRTWALELGQYGITVNAVAPGPIVTDMFTDVIPEESDQAASLAASLPVRRLGQPDDVARAVTFFLHPDNGFVTGQTLFVCGGASVGSLSL